jgi:two-component system response regulator RpfG
MELALAISEVYVAKIYLRRDGEPSGAFGELVVGSGTRLANPLLRVFAARIRSALDARNVVATAEGRATELANCVGRSVSSATRWLNGEMLPSLETLAQISTTYDVSLDYLLGLTAHDDGLEPDSGVSRVEAPRDPQPVLILDDESTARAILNEIVTAADQQNAPVVFGAAPEALRWASSHWADLVIVDYLLPGTDGLEFVRNLRRFSHFAEVPVLMVTGVEDRELYYRALRQGINDFLRKPIDFHEGIARCRNLLAMARHQALLRDRSSVLAALVDERTASAKESERRSLLLLAQLVEWRNGTDLNHAERVSAVAGLLAQATGLESDEIEAVELGAAIHDIGTLAVPDDFLGEATASEEVHSESFRAHTTLGYQLLKAQSSEPLRTAALIALGHHERFNGGGYPTGLRGDHIPLVARITAAADRLETLWMGSEEWENDQAWASFAAERATGLDPQLVDALIARRDRVEKIFERLARNAQAILPVRRAGNAAERSMRSACERDRARASSP